MTHLRKMMLEELQRRHYSEATTQRYIRFIERFAQHFHRSPDRLGPGHIRQCSGCGHRATISYNSCRNRHCPKCQTSARTLDRGPWS